jgi:uncharacterized protein YlxW (UPF0749 family)
MEPMIIDYYNNYPSMINIIDKLNDELNNIQNKNNQLKDEIKKLSNEIESKENEIKSQIRYRELYQIIHYIRQNKKKKRFLCF